MARDRKYTTEKPGYEAVKAYREAKKIVRVPLDMREDEAAALRQYCADHGLTVAGFIRELVKGAISAHSDPVQSLPAGESEGAAGAAVGPENNR